MESLEYKLEGIYQDYPFGYNDLINLNEQGKRSAAMALILAVNNFQQSNNYIITGVTYDGSKYLAGWAYIDGHVVRVPEKTMSQGTDALVLTEVNTESVLWGDGTTRTSIVQYQVDIVPYTSDPGQFQLSGLTRIEHAGAATLAANFSSTGIVLTAFKGRVKVSGRVNYTGGATAASGTLVCTIPAAFRPSYDYAFQAPYKTGNDTALCLFTVTASTGEVKLIADNVNTNDPLYVEAEWPL